MASQPRQTRRSGRVRRAIGAGAIVLGTIAASHAARLGSEAATEALAKRAYAAKVERLREEDQSRRRFQDLPYGYFLGREKVVKDFAARLRKHGLDERLLDHTKGITEWDAALIRAQRAENKAEIEQCRSRINYHIERIRSLYESEQRFFDDEYAEAKRKLEINPKQLAKKIGRWATMVPPAILIAWLILRTGSRGRKGAQPDVTAEDLSPYQ